ncbi:MULTISPECIES: putative signal transducing protein [Vibrio]|uniref:DUF2007 domain-containing protein n=1 Tax=Vibrio casei TaxID=673372 RepID=A0A368LNI4_9VIBR|nr:MULTISPECIES: DUF2007 domain-containing protein [Vibrio]RCS73388.1 DUF2007 domain-containing protein [Vibrio casei]SJN17372.1 hypothetical protein FM109_01110 [Vibrio casei]HBV75865.1 DUF2007 domain-containing protein [Vibrio sp.]
MKIFSAHDPIEAHIVRGLLESQNIHAEVHSDNIFSLKGEIPMTNDTDPYVWLVNDRFEKQAKDIITEYENRKDDELPNWICNQCNESVEATFAVCWNCGNSDHKQ